MNELRIIIAGSRDFDNYKVLEDESSKIIEKELNDDIQSIRIISGTARGADQLGERFAKKYNYSISCFPAEWGLYGKSAGYRRNAEMAKFAVSNNNIGNPLIDKLYWRQITNPIEDESKVTIKIPEVI